MEKKGGINLYDSSRKGVIFIIGVEHLPAPESTSMADTLQIAPLKVRDWNVPLGLRNGFYQWSRKQSNPFSPMTDKIPQRLVMRQKC